MSEAAELIAQALAHHRAGELARAEALYRQVLAAQPDQFDALHLMGVIAFQSGRADEAIALIARALAVNPNVAEVHDNHGRMLLSVQRTSEAAEAFGRAVAINPRLVGAHVNRGRARKLLGQLRPAVDSFRLAAALDPNQLEAAFEIGYLLDKLGDQAGAAGAYMDCVRRHPDHAEAHHNLAVILTRLGRADDAIAEYRRACELKPNAVEPLNNLGNHLRHVGRIDEAIATYRRAIELRPEIGFVHSNFASALKDAGLVQESLAEFRRAVELSPELHSAASNILLAMHYNPRSSAQEIWREHLAWAKRYADPLTAGHPAHGNDRDPERRLRVGYVSPDFRRHPVATFVEPLLAQHERARFEVFCYSSTTRPDELTQRLRRTVDQWRDIAEISDEAAARVIRSDGIDILVDLAGHTATNRLLIFARKPAPVQVTWLGYPDTTGMSAMDWRLSDGWDDPAGLTDALHRERLWRLGRPAWCFRPQTSEPVGELPAERNGFVTFGSVGAAMKINPPLVECWARILTALAGSKLILRATGSFADRLGAQFESAGVARDRVEFIGRVSEAEYWKLFSRIDIGLDTFPYNGYSTTCDTLWMGVPVVALAGSTPVSRGGVSLLTGAGMERWIAETPDDYVRLAGEHGRDLAALAGMRAGLRARIESSALRDEKGFSRDVEAAFREMWRQWCAGG